MRDKVDVYMYSQLNMLFSMFQVLEYRGLPRLMEMVESSSPEESVKALYAVSAMIRNFPLGQQEFYMNGGAGLLEVKI